MHAELTRSFQNLQKAPLPPYFLSYQLTDNRAIDITSSFGAIMGSSDQSSRLLDLDLRVGDYTLDNTHPLRGGEIDTDFASMLDRQPMPLDDDPNALKVALWRETESKYRHAVQRFQKVKANVQVQVAAEDQSGDFSHEAPETYFETPTTYSIDSAAWEQKLRRITAPFAQHPEILENSAEFIAEIETFVSLLLAPGRTNSLAQTLIKFTAPGVPDTGA